MRIVSLHRVLMCAAGLQQCWPLNSTGSAACAAHACSPHQANAPPPFPFPPPPLPHARARSYDFFLSSPVLAGQMRHECEFDWGGTRIFVSTAIVEGLRCFFIEPKNGFFATPTVYGRYDDEVRARGWLAGAAAAAAASAAAVVFTWLPV